MNTYPLVKKSYLNVNNQKQSQRRSYEDKNECKNNMRKVPSHSMVVQEHSETQNLSFNVPARVYPNQGRDNSNNDGNSLLSTSGKTASLEEDLQFAEATGARFTETEDTNTWQTVHQRRNRSVISWTLKTDFELNGAQSSRDICLGRCQQWLSTEVLL